MKNTFKRMLALLMTVAMVLSMGISASAANTAVTVTLNGQVIETAAYVDGSSRTQVPVSMAEKLGMTVTKDGTSVTFAKGDKTVTIHNGEAAGDTKVAEGYAPLRYLAEQFGYQVSWDSQTKTAGLVTQVALTMADVSSIQAYTDETVYGTGVVEVKVTYKNGVDLSGVDAGSYILEDRGSLSPDYAQMTIASAVVSGQTVTLKISDRTAATAANKLIYTGDNAEGVRERNALGIYCTEAWYRDTQGVIHYGKEDSGEYKANTTGMGYQSRECLELKLRHTGEAESAAACLANDKGQYNVGGLWLKTVDRQFGEGKFQSFENLGIRIESTASDTSKITDGTDDKYVRGYAYIPANYDPADGIVFTLQGQGISYWKLPDGTDNEGTGIRYDSATTSWIDNGAIVVNIHDRSPAGPGQYFDVYDFVIDDTNVMQYFIDTYGVTGNVVLQGNSRGTRASAMVIKALAGQPYNPQNQNNKIDAKMENDVLTDTNFTIDVYICQNGRFGYQYDEEDWAAIAATGMRVWLFDGEQDSNNVEAYGKYVEALLNAGYSEEWIEENIRTTGYPSEIYAYWGESDHSTTRINGWYFDDTPYYGPDLKLVDGEIVYNTKLNEGDTYTLECRGSAAGSNKVGFEHTIYSELYQVWALEK